MKNSEIKISESAAKELESLKENGTENICLIYGHYNPEEDKWYIGQTIHWNHPENRWGSNGSKYLNDSNSNRKFTVALKEVGWNSFEHHILKYCKRDELFFYENYFINFYNSFKNGYNETEGNKNLSEESRKKISESKKGTMTGKENHMYGKHVSQETRNKLSKSHIGKKDSNETRAKKSLSNMGHAVSQKTIEHIRNLNKGKSSAMLGITGANHHSSKKVIFLDKDGKISFEFDSLREAADYFNIKSPSTISRYCRSDKEFKTLNGDKLKIRYKDMKDVPKRKTTMSQKSKEKLSKSKKGKNILNGNHIKKIDMLDKDGNKLMTFDSAVLAAEYLNMPNPSHIRACCRGERKTCYGYKWKYADN